MTGDSTSAVRSTERSLDVIETLQQLGGARLTELADELELPNSTVHNHLTTLVNKGYVVKEGHQYHVGLRFLDVGEYARRSRRAYAVSRDELDSLSERTGETALLLTEESGVGVVLYAGGGDEAVPLDLRPGARIPLGTSGLGRALLAYLPDERIEELVDEGDPHGDATADAVADADSVVDRLSDVRERGYGYDVGERHPRVGSVGTAVRDETGNVLASVGVAGPAGRYSEERIEELATAIQTTADVIELHLAHS